MSNEKVIMIHGNGGEGTSQKHWFPWVKNALTDLGLEVFADDFPDPKEAKASIWLPHIEKLGANGNTILIGHSSGASAAMRFAEDHKILGSILVAAACTHGNDDREKISGYYNDQWNWEEIKGNQKWIVQFHSTDDPYIRIDEARLIHEMLDTEYHEFTNKHHFGNHDYPMPDFPELIEAIKRKL